MVSVARGRRARENTKAIAGEALARGGLKLPVVWAPFVLVAFSACSSTSTEGDAPPAEGAAAGVAPPVGGVPTYYQDLAPIFSAKCVTCHQEGGVAPFALNDYEAARARGTQIADYTENRVMPPYSMQTGGACGSFDESPALSAEEIALIGAWGRGERAEGTPTTVEVPPLPSLEGATPIELPEFTPQISGTEVAAFDEYRCFLVDPGLDQLQFITGYEVSPGNREIVHHILGFIVAPQRTTADGRSNAEVMQALHDGDPTPEREGWTCFGGAGEGVRPEAVPITWGPGQTVFQYADGLGVPLAPGRQLVVQVHYNLADAANRGESDHTRLALQLAPIVARPAAFILEDPLLDSLEDENPHLLAPGERSVKYVWEKTGAEMGLPPGIQAELVTLMPHMHQRGRKFTFEVDGGSGYDCEGQIDHWDFNWQRHYDYATPLPFNADTRVRVTCDFDTSDATEPVSPGWGTRNEMCLATLMLALPASTLGPTP
jgi:copper type II ascorbate-dependent monooxygenase-like protein